LLGISRAKHKADFFLVLQRTHCNKGATNNLYSSLPFLPVAILIVSTTQSKRYCSNPPTP
jgi:hypothetical protein